ncbi:MAG: prepilin-type N-terminal cleavage/methylation domain-containing protein [Bacteriovoracaceae bacterium]|nr:prepilin-type N-terminal cleavage/methylation domain-containing protein [Bacteriovoracaceae bacterium]
MKTLRWMVQSQSGFSLIEIMIVSAMMAGVAMVSTQMAGNQMKNAKTIEKKFGVIQEAESQKFLLSKSVNCNKSLEGIDLDDLGGGDIDVPKLVKSDGVISTDKWVVGNDYDNGNINLDSIKLNSFDVDPDEALYGDVNMRINWKKLGKFYGPEMVFKDIPLRVTVDADNVVQNCYTTSGGDGGASVWLEHVDGIYYSDAIAAKVTIGKDPSTAVATFEVLGNAAIGTNSSVTATTGFAIGGLSSADYGLALGERASASDDASIAIGSSADAGYVAASGDASVAIGSANTWNPHASSPYNKGALATGDGSVAIGGAGYDPTLSAWSSIAQREGAQASGDYSIAMGVRSEAEEMNSIAIGVVSWAGSDAGETGNRPYSIAIGANAYSNDSKTIALGYKSYAGEYGANDSNTDNAGAIAIGETVYAKDKYSIAIGSSAVAGNSGEDPGAVGEGDESIAIGRSSRAYDKRSIAIGASSTAGGATVGSDIQNGVAIGYSSSATGANSVAVGQDSNGGGSYAVAVGDGATAGSSRGIAIGRNASVTDSYGISIGSGAVTGNGGASFGEESIAIGRDSVASNEQTIAIGFEAEATGIDGVSIGYSAKASAYSLGALGEATGVGSVAIGRGAKAEHDYSMVVSPQFLLFLSPDVRSSTTEQYTAYFDNGYRFCTNSDIADPCGQRFYISTSGTYGTISDRNRKDKFIDIDPDEFFNKILEIDVQRWNYKTSMDPKDQHIGPMAQDFYKIFEIGEDDKVIDGVDIDGVNLMGLKSVALKEVELENRVVELESENASLKSRLERLESIVEKLSK